MDQEGAPEEDGGGGGEVDQEEADEEEEEGDPVVVSQAGAARSAEKKSKPIRHRMVVTQHPVSTKKQKTPSKTPTKRLDDSDDADDGVPDAPAPENINSDDEPAEPEDLPEPDLSRKTRRFSQLGFLMTFCTAGLTAASAVSDAAKIRVIGHIEREKGIQCSAKPWGSYSAIEQIGRAHV